MTAGSGEMMIVTTGIHMCQVVSAHVVLRVELPGAGNCITKQYEILCFQHPQG